SVDEEPPRANRCSGHDRGRGGVRLSGRDEASGTTMGAAARARMAVSALLGTAALVASLCLHRPGFRDSCRPRASAPRAPTSRGHDLEVATAEIGRRDVEALYEHFIDSALRNLPL